MVDRTYIINSNIEQYEAVKDALNKKLKTILILEGEKVKPVPNFSFQSCLDFLKNTKQWSILHLGIQHGFMEDIALDENPKDNIKRMIGDVNICSFAYIINLNDHSGVQYVHVPNLYTNNSFNHKICNSELYLNIKLKKTPLIFGVMMISTIVSLVVYILKTK